ncbi:alginate export family protein [Cytophagaceae bacterium ABcell3]|nr:alginate export family protein [Cytophagaceae bacterium ABcell3]
MKSIRIILFVLLSCMTASVYAQFTISGQVRTRTEFRDGWGTLPVEGASPNFFTSQRTRLNVGYKMDRLNFFIAAQDIRVWGADMSTIANAVGSWTFLHEGWGEITLTDTASNMGDLYFKLGRQEIKYDDARLLGNLDWLQQARRHDAAILKYRYNGFEADLGAAYNQGHMVDVLGHGNYYPGVPAATIHPGNPVGFPPGTNALPLNYKSMQYLYLAKKTNIGRATALVFKDDFQEIGGRGTNSRITAGGTFFGNISPVKFQLGGYYQGNNDPLGNTLDAYNLLANVSYNVKKFTFTGGFDLLSGQNSVDPEGRNTRFDPLYGTPHLFWGFMDYFYVATPYGLPGTGMATSPGLLDVYAKASYKVNSKFNALVHVHNFSAAAPVAGPDGEAMDSRLGTEIDLVFNYTIAKNVTVQGAYCMMFGTETMNRVKHPTAARIDSGTTPFAAGTDQRLFGQWAYLMINMTPSFLN